MRPNLVGIHLLPYLLALCVFLTSKVDAQAIDPDLVDFTAIKIWPDLRKCLQGCFTSYGSIQKLIGCTTNGCLCRADTLGDAAVKVQSLALSTCSNIADQTSASSILTAYCSEKHYTSIIPPTILATGASCTSVPTRTVTVTSYTTVYVKSAAAGNLSHSRAVMGVLVVFFVFVSM